MRVGTLIGTWGGRAKQCLRLRACVACDCVRNIAVGVSRPSLMYCSISGGCGVGCGGGRGGLLI